MTAGHREMDGESGLWKAWVLSCVERAHRMGILPLSGPQIHVVLYLANTLAPFFGVMRIRGRVLKRGSAPFYPDVQPELDRLAYSGVLTVKKVEFGPRGICVASYGLGPQGSLLAEKLRALPEAQRTARLFNELLSVCFGGFLMRNVDIGSVDANYASNNLVDGQVVDFSEWADDNKNVAAAQYLLVQLRALSPDLDRDGVRLYCGYLEEALS